MIDGQTAVLVIDVQEGMFNIAGVNVHEARGFLSRVAELLLGARASGVPVIYVQHVGRPGHALAPDTEGFLIHREVAPQEGELVVQKKESDAFLGTTLQTELATLGTTGLVVCGMQTEYCVDTTCRRAHGLGYAVLLAEDGHTTFDSDSLTAGQIIAHHNETLGNAYVTLCRTGEVFTEKA